jgi:thiosulfate/3-mercaptopyruvate sulfurtransferase
MLWNSNPSRVSLALLLLAFFPGLLALAKGPADDAPILVTADWVAEHLGDRDLIVLHVGSGYDEGHISGARLVDASVIARSQAGLRLQMLPVEELEANFAGLGISNDSRIVIYATNSVTMAARLYVALDYVGLGSRTSIMDGGLAAWKTLGGALTTEETAIGPGELTVVANPSVVVTAGWLERNLDNPAVAVIDARTPRYYSGARGGHGQSRAGHIAGAGNVPYSSVIDEETGKFKDVGELRTRFEAAGAAQGDEVVTYCHIGQQASLAYVAARYLGYTAALYDGSFEEWSNLERLPVEQPAADTRPTLISTAELAGLLEEGRVTVLDARSDLNEYLQGHVPGASYVHYESLRATRAGVPADILEAGGYAAVFSQLGVERDRPVVIYGDGQGTNFNATFVAWVLEAFSHPSVRLLDGGFAKWTMEDRVIARGYPDTEATTFTAEGFDPTRASLDWVQWTVENAGTPDGDVMVLVDVRPPDQYAGRAGSQVRRGHIPGALNHPWSSDLVAQGETKIWRPVDELLASYEAQGITRDRHVILYCNTGTEATHAYFALKNLLGYPNVDVYFPSWTEWAERMDLPIETLATGR